MSVSLADDRPHFKHWPRRLPRRIATPDTSLWFNLEVAARRFPTKGALVFFGREQSYAELHRDAEALAGWLQRQAGVRRGDRVLLYMQNCPQYVAAFYAILRADAVVVPINPMNRAEELKHYISDPQARVAICSADLAAHLESASSGLAEDERLQHLLVARYADAMPASFDDRAEAPPMAMEEWLRADPPLPNGATRWGEALAAGVVPTEHRSQPDDLAVMPYTSGTTGLPKGCMHTHRTLMHNVVGGGLWGCSSAEAVTLGAVPLFHITGMMYGVLCPVYGASTVVLMPRWDRELAARLIERRGVTHWTCVPTMIIDLLACPELPSFDLSSLRYLNGGGAAMPQAVAERLFEQYGLMFAEGYFFLTDRLKRMINASGFKVWPAEVEALMYKHPDIQEACVIATHDAYRGESVKVVVVLKPAARGKTTEADIVAWARDNMAAYKCPRVVEFAESLPKSGSGKVMWRLLQDRERERGHRH